MKKPTIPMRMLRFTRITTRISIYIYIYIYLFSHFAIIYNERPGRYALGSKPPGDRSQQQPGLRPLGEDVGVVALPDDGAPDVGLGDELVIMPLGARVVVAPVPPDVH